MANHSNEETKTVASGGMDETEEKVKERSRAPPPFSTIEMSLCVSLWNKTLDWMRFATIKKPVSARARKREQNGRTREKERRKEKERKKTSKRLIKRQPLPSLSLTGVDNNGGDPFHRV